MFDLEKTLLKVQIKGLRRYVNLNKDRKVYYLVTSIWLHKYVGNLPTKNILKTWSNKTFVSYFTHVWRDRVWVTTPFSWVTIREFLFM